MPAAPVLPADAASVGARRLRPRDVAVAVGYAIVVVALVGVGIRTAGLFSLTALWGHGISLMLLLLAALGTLWRRQRPALTLAITGALSTAEILGTGQVPAYLLLCDAVWAPIVHGSRRLAHVTTALTAALAILILLASISSTDALGMGLLDGVVLALAIIAVVLVTPLLWGWEVRRHAQARRVAEALARTQQDLAAERAARAVETERRRIAQDLHDVVAGHVSAVALHARLAESLPDDGARRNSLRTAADSAGAALRDLRSVIAVLTTDGADAAPAPTISWDDLARRLGEDAHCEIDPGVEGDEIDAATRATLQRIGAEATSNALRHGRAPRRLSVRLEESAVVLGLTNRLPEGPRAPSDGLGLGLAAMADRARAVGGTVRIGARPGGTWEVQARLPRRAHSGLAAVPVLEEHP